MPSIIPALPPRPAAPNVSATIAYYQTATPPPNPAGTILYADTLDPMTGGPPGPFFNPSWGSPLFFASHEFVFDAVFANHGTIWNFSTAWDSTAVFTDILQNEGTIIGEVQIPFSRESTTHYGTARGVIALVKASNSGTIQAAGIGGNAIALVSESVRQTFTNSGTIAAQASYGHDPQQSGGAQAVVLENGGYLVNESSGRILAEGAGLARAVTIGRGEHPAFDGGPALVNRGLIEAVSTDPAYQSVGVFAVNLTTITGIGERMVIDNSGTIRADIATYAPTEPGETFTTSIIVAPQTVLNRAGGVIDGAVMLFRGADRLENRGTVTGRIDMGDGRDLVDNVGGTINGYTDLSFGDDEYLGSSGLDAVLGFIGNDTISGNGGADLLLGGWGDDRLIGGAGNDGLYGEAGDDILVTVGGDFASGGLGGDRFEAGDYGFARIDGGADWDVWALPAGARSIDLSQVVATGRLAGIEQIEQHRGRQ